MLQSPTDIYNSNSHVAPHSRIFYEWNLECSHFQGFPDHSIAQSIYFPGQIQINLLIVRQYQDCETYVLHSGLFMIPSLPLTKNKQTKKPMELQDILD